MTRDFTDESEKDVEYATGAKDVEDEHYGWACAITSQEISYAYGPGPGKDMPPSAEELPARAEEDLLLTMIVMYQKYTCMIFNEKIHQRFTSGAGKVKKEKNLREISQKINLLNEEQDRIDGQRESRVSMIITVFGLVSIVSAALQMLDYISTGKPLMIIGFLVTGTAIILFFLYLIFNERKKKRKREKR